MKGHIKKTTGLILIAFSMGLFLQCNSSTRDDAESADEARAHLIEELNNLQSKIDKHMEDIDERIEDADGNLRDRLMKTKAKMQQHKLELDYEIQKIKNTSDQSWKELNKNAQNKLQEAEESVKEAGRDVEEFFDDDKVRESAY